MNIPCMSIVQEDQKGTALNKDLIVFYWPLLRPMIESQDQKKLRFVIVAEMPTDFPQIR
jgi:hypothetical protein